MQLARVEARPISKGLISARGVPSFSSLDCFYFMVRATKALAIGRIEWQTIVFEFDYVIDIHAVVWCCLATSVTIDHSLALAISSSHHQRTPRAEVRGIVDWFYSLGWQASGAGVGYSHQRTKGSEFAH